MTQNTAILLKCLHANGDTCDNPASSALPLPRLVLRHILLKEMWISEATNSMISPNVMADSPSQSPSWPPISEIRFWDCKERRRIRQFYAREVDE